MPNMIFIYSLPRSGSTLLQRILASHPQIASTAEPWVALSPIYTLRTEGTLSEYNHKLAAQATNEFINNLPNGKKDYYESIRKFLFDLYSKQCINNERYFLDKTPRYYSIIEDIDAVFPCAKSIFLFRNPVQTFASIISSRWQNRLYGLATHYQDLTQGPVKLANAYQRMQSKSLAVRYEELVNKPSTSYKVEKYICYSTAKGNLKKIHQQP
jgi:hypothetical protein